MFGADDIAALFTRDGNYLCARWGRPVAPVIFGLSDETLAIFRDVTRAALVHAGHPQVETDPEMGANLMSFFVRDWDELAEIPDLDGLTGQQDLPQRLKAQTADQYRIFRFDSDGGIRACMTFVNMGGGLADAHPAGLAEVMVMRALLTFAQDVTPSRELADLIRVAYDPVLPVVARDQSHAMRLAARLQRR
ncbi:hypothetical protein ACEUZ9_005253 [Paracoccus litorisediminis]|uniref:Uncharacterized protein n=1 Tax=Paracoccus litorisediminis TaxID=2006130 RepID=A0A844HIN3_9RHOB|nr:hypothetical protein [Paracoccus litorisediminis]MTH58879.1 hypothetical protein [Paracoccus litorisediminis]